MSIDPTTFTNDKQSDQLYDIYNALVGGGISAQTVAANGSLSATNGTLSANTSTSVLSTSAASKYVFIQNNSTGTLYLAFGTAATTSNGIQIPVGAALSFESLFVVTSSVNLLSVAGTTTGSSYVIWYA